MPDAGASPSNLCYCTNVHAGTTPEEIRASPDSARARDRFCPGGPLGLGLWLPDGLSFRLDDDRFALRTYNGFPFGNFHQKIVKHSVYEPSWVDLRRSNYTWTLGISIMEGAKEVRSPSISTVPLGWAMGEDDLKLCGEQLRGLAVSLSELAERPGGKVVTIDLEPEPGCVLDTSGDVVRFFDEHLRNSIAREHVGVCHDVCHASVMFEDQREALKNYIDHGIAVNKVQVSCAPRAVFGEESRQTLDALAAFREERYLHQTCVKSACGEVTFYEDLPLALDRAPVQGDEWRTHFHVPVYLEALGELQTSQSDILACMDACAELGIDPMWEVETYAWSVLPEEFRVDDLSEGIAKELLWTRERLVERGLARC